MQQKMVGIGGKDASAWLLGIAIGGGGAQDVSLGDRPESTGLINSPLPPGVGKAYASFFFNWENSFLCFFSFPLFYRKESFFNSLSFFVSRVCPFVYLILTTVQLVFQPFASLSPFHLKKEKEVYLHYLDPHHFLLPLKQHSCFPVKKHSLLTDNC